ncbi:hypothetical protein CVV65_05710 [Kyrpidia spormannii]|uniref:DUF4277 domain-containing protein n=1 Tax=Kyrpidia spormannii TaxID=2055160 RepID=A0A2K8N5B8_9BACL|nr:DUF4277 domain-containing protein [Kyrpidia spormannii]ATY84513.1 hypothetical protein CVV65_05710 [Kyrpidia spormannii]
MQLPGVTVEVHKLEAAPLVAYLCRELRVAEIIDAHVTWNRLRTEVSPGTAITALLVNLLVRREPLYPDRVVLPGHGCGGIVRQWHRGRPLQ